MRSVAASASIARRSMASRGPTPPNRALAPGLVSSFWTPQASQQRQQRAPFASAAAAVPIPSTVPPHPTTPASSPQPDFVEEAIQRLLQEAAGFAPPPPVTATSTTPVMKASSSSAPQQSRPEPHISNQVLEQSIKTFQVRSVYYRAHSST